jgi:acetyltransferase-like isoleucine patch superfamily enzyme
MLLTNRQPEYKQFDIGEWTFGAPTIASFIDNGKLKIGKFCSISDGVIILLGGEHNYHNVSTYPFDQLLIRFRNIHIVHSKGDVTIGNDVWIGRNALILSGVTVGDGAVIAAGAVVTHNVLPYEIVAGTPARHLKFRFDALIVKQLMKLKWWDLPWKELRELIPLLMKRPDIPALALLSNKSFKEKVAYNPLDEAECHKQSESSTAKLTVPSQSKKRKQS